VNRRDRIAILEGIAYSQDPDVRAGDRLRSLELLAAERDDPDVDVETLVRRDTARLSEEDVHAWLDALLVAEFSSGVRSARYPELAGLLQREVDRRAAEIADPLRIEREMYEGRAFSLIEGEATEQQVESADEDDSPEDDGPQFEVFRRITTSD
jgi:hypothetical protein